MKKFLLSIATVLLFGFCFCLFACAEDVQPSEDIVIGEDIAETTDEVTEETTETTDETTSTQVVKENTSELVDKVIAIATSSTFWTTAASIITGIVTVLVVFITNINKIKASIKNKADNETVRNVITGGVTEIGNSIAVNNAVIVENLKKVEKELENEKNNSKQMAVILATYILHSKIGTSAKAEIMKMFNGYKEYTGTMNEILEQVEDAIKTAEKEEEKVETPALDEIISLSLN